MRFTDWLPPMLWMGVILFLSTDYFSPLRTGVVVVPLFHDLLPQASAGTLQALHFAVRKAAHMGEYGVLALLWYRAFVRGGALAPSQAAGLALAITVGWAGCDEAFQAFMPTRSARLADVVYDSTGAALALLGAMMDPRGRIARLVLGAAGAG